MVRKKKNYDTGVIVQVGYDDTYKTHIYVHVRTNSKLRLAVPDGLICEDVDVSNWRQGEVIDILKGREIEISFTETDEYGNLVDPVFSKFIEN